MGIELPPESSEFRFRGEFRDFLFMDSTLASLM